MKTGRLQARGNGDGHVPAGQVQRAGMAALKRQLNKLREVAANLLAQLGARYPMTQTLRVNTGAGLRVRRSRNDAVITLTYRRRNGLGINRDFAGKGMANVNFNVLDAWVRAERGNLPLSNFAH